MICNEIILENRHQNERIRGCLGRHALSHLLLCNIHSFDADFAFSGCFMANPGAIDPSIPNIVERKLEIILRLLPLISWKRAILCTA